MEVVDLMNDDVMPSPTPSDVQPGVQAVGGDQQITATMANIEAGGDDQAVTCFSTEFEGLALPADPTSPGFASGIQASRGRFSGRPAYNAYICDQLSMRGIAPNASNVLEIGRWGSKGAVSADVRNWYAGLGARLSERNADIPQAARRAANELIESLWGMAKESARGPLDLANVEISRLGSIVVHLKNELASSEQQRATLNAEYANAMIAHQVNIEALQARIATLDDQVRGQRVAYDDLVRSTAQAALDHMAEIQKTKDDAASQLRKRQEEHEVALSVLRSDLQKLNERWQDKSAELTSALREHTLAIDSHRQDAREAGRRADKAMQDADALRGRLDAVRDALASANIENAKLALKNSTLQSELHAALADKGLPAENVNNCVIELGPPTDTNIQA